MCITGNYDLLNEIEKKESGIDYICYTNNKTLKSKTWKIVYINDESLTNVKLARKIKILGTPELKKYDFTVWIDGHIKFVTPIKEFIKKYVDLKNNDLVGFKHYCRNSVFEEINACFEAKKETKENLLKIKEFLENNRFPDDLGLIESTVLFRNFNNDLLCSAMDMWFDILNQYSHRDQLSFQYAQWKSGLKVKLLDISIWNNEYFKAIGHSCCDDISLTISAYMNDDLDLKNIIECNAKVIESCLNVSFKLKKDSNRIMISFDCKNDFIVNYITYENASNIEKYYYMNCSLIENKILFSSNPVLVLEGNFKRNQIISFSLNVDIKLDKNVYIDALNKQSDEIRECKNIIAYNENEIIKLDKKNSELENNIVDLNKYLDKANDEIKEGNRKYNELENKYLAIINSKSYKFISAIRKLFK